MIKIEYAFYLLLVVFFTVLYYVQQTDLILQKQYSPQVQDVLEYRRRVMLRACSVVGDLDEMTKNGTSFQELIETHRRVQNLDEKLWEPSNQCFEPVQDTGRRYVIYEIFNRNNLTETRFEFEDIKNKK